MSKHPTSELSPRDIASIEYGRQLEYLLTYMYPYRHDEDYTDFDEIRGIINDCRAARERVFRTCDECAHEDAFDCTARNERLCDCFGFKDYAPTCPHYKERRGS